MTKLLEVWTNEDGEPWAPFVFGAADPSEVAAMVTRDAVNEVTSDYIGQADLPENWQPDIRTHYIRMINPAETESLWQFCDADDPGATLITGHRFAGGA